MKIFIDLSQIANSNENSNLQPNTHQLPHNENLVNECVKIIYSYTMTLFSLAKIQGHMYLRPENSNDINEKHNFLPRSMNFWNLCAAFEF